MYKNLTLRIVLMLCGFSGTALAGGDGPNPVFTGTVNIVLANANGIVVLTDSNQTGHRPNGEPFTRPVPGQKLFRIDDRTVCTIAGFGSTSLPNFPEFTSSAAGVLDRYAVVLRSKGGTHGFHEKLTSLGFLFRFQLSGIENLQHLHPEQLGDYGFELILTGYDTDGTPKIGTIAIRSTLLPNGMFSPVLEELKETTVGSELAHATAGIGGADVENILAYPAHLAEEPEIARYAASKASDHGSSLTTAEMEVLALSLAHHSALDNRQTYFVVHELGSPFDFRTFWPVGGQNQIAVLEKESIQTIDQPTLLFEERRVSMTNFSIVSGGTLEQNSLDDAPLIVFSTPGLIVLYLKERFLGGLIHLDSAYYFEDDFKNATLHYEGGVLAFDPSNRVTDCILSLGPHVNRKSPAVRDLIARFTWKTVQ